MLVTRPPVRHPRTPVKVAFVTGLSDPSSCSLNRAYGRFLEAVACPEDWKVYRNFPYLPVGTAEEDEPLWRASLANLQQFVRAGTPAYRNGARRHLEALSASADRVILLVGSCGLEILNQAWSDAVSGEKVRIFAWGPVARARPVAPHTLIRGTRDHLSRLFFRQVDVTLPGTGHLDYVHHPRVLHLFNSYLWSSISA